MERVRPLTMTTDDRNVAAAIFRRELMDKIRVLRTPPRGGARIQQDLWVQKIEISGDKLTGAREDSVGVVAHLGRAERELPQDAPCGEERRVAAET
jgi:hypothetical protein